MLDNRHRAALEQLEREMQAEMLNQRQQLADELQDELNRELEVTWEKALLIPKLEICLPHLLTFLVEMIKVHRELS